MLITKEDIQSVLATYDDSNQYNMPENLENIFDTLIDSITDLDKMQRRMIEPSDVSRLRKIADRDLDGEALLELVSILLSGTSTPILVLKNKLPDGLMDFFLVLSRSYLLNPFNCKRLLQSNFIARNFGVYTKSLLEYLSGIQILDQNLLDSFFIRQEESYQLSDLLPNYESFAYRFGVTERYKIPGLIGGYITRFRDNPSLDVIMSLFLASKEPDQLSVEQLRSCLEHQNPLSYANVKLALAEPISEESIEESLPPEHAKHFGDFEFFSCDESGDKIEINPNLLQIKQAFLRRKFSNDECSAILQHPHPAQLIVALSILASFSVWHTLENIETLIKYPAPLAAVTVLFAISKKLTLSPAYFKLVTQVPNIENLIKNNDIYDAAPLLTSLQILQYHQVFTKSDIFTRILSLSYSQLYTMYEAILRAQQNQADILSAINEALEPKQPNLSASPSSAITTKPALVKASSEVVKIYKNAQEQAQRLTKEGSSLLFSMFPLGYEPKVKELNLVLSELVKVSENKEFFDEDQLLDYTNNKMLGNSLRSVLKKDRLINIHETTNSYAQVVAKESAEQKKQLIDYVAGVLGWDSSQMISLTVEKNKLIFKMDNEANAQVLKANLTAVMPSADGIQLSRSADTLVLQSSAFNALNHSLVREFGKHYNARFNAELLKNQNSEMKLNLGKKDITFFDIANHFFKDPDSRTAKVIKEQGQAWQEQNAMIGASSRPKIIGL